MCPNNLLVVDDSPFVHKQIKAHLGADPFIIHSAYDGESGLTKAEDLHPRLVLMDIEMPGIDGLEACRRLKANPSTANTPVIFITADCSTNDKIKAFEMGATDYITKPFRPEEVRARVKAALREGSPLRQTELVDPLTGLWNQHYLDMQIPIQLSLEKRTRLPLSCIVGEIDSMQSIYEAHGRPAADQIIKAAALTWADISRPEDIACHLGGGRLVLLQPATCHADAMEFALRMRLAVEQNKVETDFESVSITCSFGVSENRRQWDGSLLEAAEQALFNARLSGGNTVAPSIDSGGRVLSA